MDEPDLTPPDETPPPDETKPEDVEPFIAPVEPDLDEENASAEAVDEGIRVPDEAADRDEVEERMPSERVEEGALTPEEGPRLAGGEPVLPEAEGLQPPDEPAQTETIAEARPDYLIPPREESPPGEERTVEEPPSAEETAAEEAAAEERIAPELEAPDAGIAAGEPTAGVEDEAAAALKAEAAREHDRLAQENVAHLQREIDELRAGHAAGEHRQYRSFFEHERRLHQLFKELRPLHTGDRHRLWTAFKQIGAEARRQQQEEWEARRYLSIEARETVEEKIRSAEALMQGEPSADEYRRVDGILNEVRSLLSSEAAGSAGQVLIGPDRRACWDRWREVRDALRRKRSGAQEQDYQTLSTLVAEVAGAVPSEDPFRSVQRVKELQARLGKAYLRRGQFEELRRKLSEAWQAAQVRIAEQRQERTRRRAEWRDRMEGHLARWRETVEHRRSQREHLLQQMEKLEGMEKNARSEDFAVQVRGWKEETSEKLRRVEEFLTDLEQRIESATKKVGGRGAREGGAEEHGSGPGGHVEREHGSSERGERRREERRAREAHEGEGRSPSEGDAEERGSEPGPPPSS